MSTNRIIINEANMTRANAIIALKNNKSCEEIYKIFENQTSNLSGETFIHHVYFALASVRDYENYEELLNYCVSKQPGSDSAGLICKLSIEVANSIEIFETSTIFADIAEYKEKYGEDASILSIEAEVHLKRKDYVMLAKIMDKFNEVQYNERL